MLAALLICLIIVNKEMAVVMATATANKSNVKGALWAKSFKQRVMAIHYKGMDSKVATPMTERYFLMSKG